MKLILGDSLDKLKDLPTGTIDCVVTDPPYGLSFMGKKWDHDVPSEDLWREVFRVMKPGAHLLSFFGTRTYHAGVTRIEAAGFEVRDMLAWLYGSGFPKSLDVSKAIDKAAGANREVVGTMPAGTGPLKRGHVLSTGGGMSIGTERSPELSITAPATDDAKRWQGWGTALKPANEPIVLARKPLEKGLTVAQNVLKWGTGALNIDGTRIGTDVVAQHQRDLSQAHGNNWAAGTKQPVLGKTNYTVGRWPANVLFDEEAAAMLDEQSGALKSGKPGIKRGGNEGPAYGSESRPAGTQMGGFGDSGGASRFFYVAKTSKRERNAGLKKDEFIWESCSWERPDLKLALAATLQLAKDTSEDILTEEYSWSTVGSGLSTLDQSRPALISIIKTALKLITELKTSNASQNLNTRESIQDAIVTIEATGLSLAESVALTSQLTPNTTSEKTASALGVVRALLKTLQPIRDAAKSGNFHATVKPIRLMEYLCKLVCPPGGIVLDPFMGSGTTGCAAVKLGLQFIGIEREAEYLEIARRRIEHWSVETWGDPDEDDGQMQLPLEPA